MSLWSILSAIFPWTTFLAFGGMWWNARKARLACIEVQNLKDQNDSIAKERNELRGLVDSQKRYIETLSSRMNALAEQVVSNAQANMTRAQKIMDVHDALIDGAGPDVAAQKIKELLGT